MDNRKSLYDISWQGKVFKLIPNIESYAISKDGEVLALPKVRDGKLSQLNNMIGREDKSQRKYKAKVIKPSFKTRYWYVNLMHNGIKQSYRVHRLVYTTYIGAIPSGKVIDHIDGNTSNNNLSNLRCVSQSENCQNPNTLMKKFKAVLQIDKSSKDIVGEYPSVRDAMLSLGIPYNSGMSSHIGDVCKGKRKSCYGYEWRWK